MYGTCFTTPNVAPRPLYKGNAEDDVRSRRFFALSSPKNVYATRAKFPRHKHQVCPREASCSHGGSAYLPCHKKRSSLPQTSIFLATNDPLAWSKTIEGKTERLIQVKGDWSLRSKSVKI